jgi:hypothetical protein
MTLNEMDSFFPTPCEGEQRRVFFFFFFLFLSLGILGKKIFLFNNQFLSLSIVDFGPEILCYIFSSKHKETKLGRIQKNKSICLSEIMLPYNDNNYIVVKCKQKKKRALYLILHYILKKKRN